MPAARRSGEYVPLARAGPRALERRDDRRGRGRCSGAPAASASSAATSLKQRCNQRTSLAAAPATTTGTHVVELYDALGRARTIARHRDQPRARHRRDRRPTRRARRHAKALRGRAPQSVPALLGRARRPARPHRSKQQSARSLRGRHRPRTRPRGPHLPAATSGRAASSANRHPTKLDSSMDEARPSRTALRVAMRRAAHQLYDAPPLVLEDPIAVPILGHEYLPEVERTAVQAAQALLRSAARLPRRTQPLRRRPRSPTPSRMASRSMFCSAPVSTPSRIATPTPTCTSSRSITPPPSSGSASCLQQTTASRRRNSLTYVPVDFEHQQLHRAARAAGFTTPRSPPSSPGSESCLISHSRPFAPRSRSSRPRLRASESSWTTASPAPRFLSSNSSRTTPSPRACNSPANPSSSSSRRRRWPPS